MMFVQDTEGNSHAVSQIAKVYRDHGRGVRAAFTHGGDRIEMWSGEADRMLTGPALAYFSATPGTALATYHRPGPDEGELVTCDQVVGWSVDQFHQLRPLFVDYELSCDFHDDMTAILHPSGIVEGWDGEKWPKLSDWVESCRRDCEQIDKAKADKREASGG